VFINVSDKPTASISGVEVQDTLRVAATSFCETLPHGAINPEFCEVKK